jgi:hypothetical protein
MAIGLGAGLVLLFGGLILISRNIDEIWDAFTRFFQSLFGRFLLWVLAAGLAASVLYGIVLMVIAAPIPSVVIAMCIGLIWLWSKYAEWQR